MKKTLLVFALVLVLGAGLFAEGAQERSTPFDAADEVTLTGTIDITSFPATLTSDGEEYLVMVPPFAVDGIAIENGQEITVTGFAHESYGRFRSGGQVIAVTSAVIDGEEYEIEMPGYGGRFARGPMGYGGRGCWGGGYGPRQGFQGGSMMGGPGGYGGFGGPRGQSGMMWGGNQPRGWR